MLLGTGRLIPLKQLVGKFLKAHTLDHGAVHGFFGIFCRVFAAHLFDKPVFEELLGHGMGKVWLICKHRIDLFAIEKHQVFCIPTGSLVL